MTFWRCGRAGDIAVDNEEAVECIMREFGLDPNTSHIINGHVPQEMGNEACDP